MDVMARCPHILVCLSRSFNTKDSLEQLINDDLKCSRFINCGSSFFKVFMVNNVVTS